MRIIRVALNEEVKELLSEIANAHCIEDVGFVYDLFILLRRKGNGLPNDQRIEAMAQECAASPTNKTKLPESIFKTTLRHRRYVLSKVASLPAVQGLFAREANPIRLLQRALSLLNAMSIKRKQSQCMSCSFLATCIYGQQYGSVVTNITYVADPNYKAKLHAQCPYKKELEGIGALVASANQLQSMSSSNNMGKLAANMSFNGKAYLDAADDAEEEAEGEFETDDDTEDSTQIASLHDNDADSEMENQGTTLTDESGHAGKTGSVGSHTGRAFADVQQSFVTNMSVQSLQIFEIGRVLAEAIEAATKGKYKPTSDPAENRRSRNIEHTNEVGAADSSEHALEDDHFDKKLAQGSLSVQGEITAKQKRHLLYFLIDESSSMITRVAPNSHMLITRGQLAATLGCVMTSRLKSEKGVAHLRMFSVVAHPMMSAETSEQFEAMSDFLARTDFNGGGTCIASAVIQALNDIAADRDKFGKCEILLITDMDDNIVNDDKKEIEELMKKHSIKLHCINVNSNPKPYGNAESALSKISTKYFKSDPNQVDIKKLVSTVK